MPNVLNKRMMQELRDQLDAAHDAVVVDFTGVSVADVSEMRTTLRKNDMRMKVVKTSLAVRAARDLGFEGADGLLTGATAIVYGGDSVATVAKTIDEISRAKKEKGPKVRGAFLEKKALGPEAVAQLAKLPSRQQLLSELVGAFIAPLSGFAGALNSLLTDFPALTQSLADKGGASGEASG